MLEFNCEFLVTGDVRPTENTEPVVELPVELAWMGRVVIFDFVVTINSSSMSVETSRLIKDFPLAFVTAELISFPPRISWRVEFKTSPTVIAVVVKFSFSPAFAL